MHHRRIRTQVHRRAAWLALLLMLFSVTAPAAARLLQADDVFGGHYQICTPSGVQQIPAPVGDDAPSWPTADAPHCALCAAPGLASVDTGRTLPWRLAAAAPPPAVPRADAPPAEPAFLRAPASPRAPPPTA